MIMSKSHLKVALIAIFLCNWSFCDNLETNGILLRSEEEKDADEVPPGLFPPLFNVASGALIFANATCGESISQEVYCKLADLKERDKPNPQCGVCDARSHDLAKRHPIEHAIDNSTSWWQSPTLEQGSKYQWVTITIDLKQEYYIWNLVMKCGISPRPASWILEKSIDGLVYTPLQYFAPDEEECWERFGQPAATSNFPNLDSDTTVVCSTYFSKLKPLEGGEVHTYVAKGRPGVIPGTNVLGTSELKQFALARFVQLRFQKLNTPRDKLALRFSDNILQRRLFYSVRSLSVGGQCICNGHARKCKTTESNPLRICQCKHNTCGTNCDYCCPLYNQRAWKEGSLTDGAPCEKCQCFGHATTCYYDFDVDRNNRSLNTKGKYIGGGVCQNCSKHTTGINCESCEIGWYRPSGRRPDAEIPCIPCDCHPIGSDGHCIPDDSKSSEGKIAGSCKCKDGFSGNKCDNCAAGFYNFPDCKRCSCDIRGSLVTKTCEVLCECKENAIGPLCNECKVGYFGLTAENPLGCKQCYCSGVSTSCKEADGYVIRTLENVNGWQIISLETESVKEPDIDPDTGILTFNTEDLDDLENNFFWLGPTEFRGNKLTSYGATLKFSITWSVMRGDTSGIPVINPDIVIVGRNGLQIHHGERIYENLNRISLSVSLSEDGWYWFSNLDDESKSINDEPLSSSTERKLQKNVSREQMLSILADIKYLLLRAKFHTDQIDTGLISVQFETGLKDTNGSKLMSVESCLCPPGYHGLSCEKCKYGYVRFWNSLESHFTCKKCDCYGHSPSCDLETGKCDVCEHNTTGEKCETCLIGYYGNAEDGSPDDCKPCACPLTDYSNNFSPTCVSNSTSSNNYFCNDCPDGYMGDHCELCSAGYYGDPLTVASGCFPCECNDSPCDSKTGKCIACFGNTEGMHCDKCKFGYYGNPKAKECKKCECNDLGSVDISTCDQITGQCKCKPNYTGLECDRCEDGLGNITAGCIPCSCNAIGSINTKCDPFSGECFCKHAILGPTCDRCYDYHYGFDSNKGCLSCNCDPIGSAEENCDEISGQCKCQPNVVGQTCNTCQDGFWCLSKDGCAPCQCNLIGSSSPVCDQNTGQCVCKTGVTGRSCDQCRNNYYGFSKFGCFECEECIKPGHICDKNNGRCVCPPYTEGAVCDKCVSSAWNFTALIGCMNCECDRHGSFTNQCNSTTGQCPCRPGYSGDKCDTCAGTYYGFPKCRRCACNIAGSIADTCSANGCLCDSNGQCYCKVNVHSKKCDECNPGAFDLHVENEAGCIGCFCFGRSSICTAANYVMGQIRTLSPRILSVRYDTNQTLQNFTISDDSLVSLALEEGDGKIILNVGNSNLNVTNNLRVIPGEMGDVEIGVNYFFNAPIYWKLPKMFLGDKVLSYGGFIKLTMETKGDKIPFPASVLATYPLVQIQGNTRLVLEYFPSFYSEESHQEIRLHESLWKIKNNPEAHVTRETFMLTLQNLQHILIRATDAINFNEAILYDVIMDTAIPISWQNQQSISAVGHSIERCECPPEYSGSSCQDPSIGYHRYYDNKTVSATIVIQLVGDVKPCECNGKSEICDKDSGYCLNCTENTGGLYCDECAEGFFNDTNSGICIPCPCPSANQNFARSCYMQPDNLPICECKLGYTGQFCDRCDVNYYGHLDSLNGSCVSCSCNPYGSINNSCHLKTGQCDCKPGIKGRDCSTCEWRQILASHGCTPCNDGCVTLLLDDVDNMKQELQINSEEISTGKIQPPWQLLNNLEKRALNSEITFEQLLKLNRDIIKTADDVEGDLRKKVKSIHNKAKKLLKLCQNMNGNLSLLQSDVGLLTRDINTIEEQINEIITNLEQHANSDKMHTSNIAAALNEARNLLSNIQDNDVAPLVYSTNQTISYCYTVQDSMPMIKDIDPDLQLLKKRFEKLTERLIDFESLISRVMSTVQEVKDLASTNKKNYMKLIDTIRKLQENESYLFELHINSTDKINLAVKLLNQSSEDIHNIKTNYDHLKDLSRLTEETESILFNLNPIYTEQYVIPAMKHADILMHSAQQYSNLFAATKHDASIALKASRAYQDIVDLIDDAKNGALNASRMAEESYSGDGKQLLVEKVIIAEENSLQLRSSAEAEANAIGSLKKQLQWQISMVQNVRENLDQTNKNKNSILRHLQDINSTRAEMQTIPRILKTSANLTGTLDDMYDNVFDIQDKITDELRAKLEKFQLVEDANIIAVEKKIKEAEDANKKIVFQLANLKNNQEKRDERFLVLNTTASDLLEALRNKIMETRHVVEAVGISLGSSESGAGAKCARSYRLDNMEPSTVSIVVMTYAISTNNRDALLFYLQSSTTNDYMAIEMVNRKIRFVWDVGGGLGEITHPHHIQTAGDLHKNQHWYKIEAERILNIGKLSVRPVVLPIGSPLKNGTPVTNSSRAGWGQFDVTNNDVVWIGGIQTDKKPISLYSKQNGLVGCIHRVLLDNKPIGLWNFKTQISDTCSACVEGAEESHDDGLYSFNGEGYATLNSAGSSVYNKYIFSITFSFKTFDENAILFYAVPSKPNQYISLAVKNGLIVFRIGYGGEAVLEVKTNIRYNTGNWTHVEATRFYDRKKKIEKAVIKVGSETREGAPSPPPSQDEIPDLSNPEYFIGGLSPGFKPSYYVPRPFLGCISDIQINQEGYNPLRGRYFGVQSSCLDKPLTVVGFNGNGYIELKSHPLKKISSFSFVFASLQQDAFLMLSTTEGLLSIDPLKIEEDDMMNLVNEQDVGHNYYSVSLRKGQIDVRLNAGFGEVKLITENSEYGDGLYHSLSLIKMGKKLELRIDDVVKSVDYLPDGSSVVKAPGSSGGLFFGSIPADISITSSVVSDIQFIGTIKNAIFDDQIVRFDQHIEFQHADIGRIGLVPSIGGKFSSVAAMHARDSNGCYKGQSFSLELAAVRFGDIPYSHVRIDFQRNTFVRKNLTMELKFRTFYQNGLLFMTSGLNGSKQSHYFMASIRSGKVAVIIKGKRKFEMTTQESYNDGIWHIMKLVRDGKSMMMYVDNIGPVKANVPKRLNILNTVYFGGIPENNSLLPETLVQKIEPLKGCIQDVMIGGRKIDLVGEKAVHHKVGQCFPQIEKGAFFSGDAYAIFKTNFYVGTLLDLELEFRTSEKAGILLSVSEPEGYPALSLEFNHGKVIMSGDMGDRRPFKIEHKFPSEYSICDNKWHKIQAHYMDDELSLKVDNIDQKYWLSDNGHLTEARTNSPLYIGGLADNVASGTLQTKENFKGCMRNVIIGGERCDWANLPVIQNVLFSSCPAAG